MPKCRVHHRIWVFPYFTVTVKNQSDLEVAGFPKMGFSVCGKCAHCGGLGEWRERRERRGNTLTGKHQEA